MATTRFKHPGTAVFLVDMQEKLLAHMDKPDSLIARTEVLLDGAKVLGLPVVCTEHYPEGLGKTIPGLASKLSDNVVFHPKKLFSGLIDPVRDQLADLAVKTVIVCGVEAHVCVLQTCLDLMDRGYQVGVVVDAIGSRKELDRQVAIARMTQAGVVPTTTESVLLDIIGHAGKEEFKAVLPLIK